MSLGAVVLLSGVCAMADYFIKQASNNVQPIWCRQFWFAAILSFLTVFAWVNVLSRMKMSSAGMIYSFCTAGAWICMGVFFFEETLSWKEILGIVFGIISIVLLGLAV